ncbi:MAG TPA: Na/Pi symporter [Bacteroidales bacterium]|nr:Na/Pi symporter [Bacteroidales bacterium]
MKIRSIIVFIAFLLIGISGYCVVLSKPQSSSIYEYSGDNQIQTVGKITENPIRVLVCDEEGTPLRDYELVFTVICNPKNAEDFRIDKKLVKTDSLGIAENYFLVGNKDGVYQIMVCSNSDNDSNTLVYQISGRKKSWFVFMIIGLVGGLALFLYAMDILSKGMQAVAGNKMRSIISKYTSNRFLALIAGIILTVLSQSSTATSVMLVGFVEAGIMSFTQTLGMLLGAGIGTTVTAQLIALRITDYSLLIVALGFGLMIFSKKSKLNNVGKAVLGCGMLFLGMYIMSEAMYPLRNNQHFIDILISFENPWIGILAGFVFTALIHSSAAFIGILITMASQGFLSIEACIPMILGTNLGTGITAILASLNSGREAQRVAFAYTFFKLIGVLVFVWWIPEYAQLVKSFSPEPSHNITTMEMMAETVPRQIANAHMVFSIGLTILILPFLNIFNNLIIKLIPAKAKPEPYKLKYINSAMTSSPAIALGMAKKETERMGNKIKKLVSLSLLPFTERDENILVKWQDIESESDFLKEKINSYLVSVSSQNSDEHQLSEAFQIMYVIKELEMIGDIINTNIRHQAVKWLACNAEFSEEGKSELLIIQEKAVKQISRAMEVFSDVNLEKAEHVKQKFKKYAQLAEEFEKHHYSRLIEQNLKSATSSEVHLELIGLLNAVSRHATNIARILLNWKR